MIYARMIQILSFCMKFRMLPPPLLPEFGIACKHFFQIQCLSTQIWPVGANCFIKSKWSLSISLDLMLRTSIRKKSCCAIQLADLTSVKFPCSNKLLIACAVLAWNRHINTITECLIAFILASTLKLVASVRYSSIPSFQNELLVSISRFVCCHWLFGGKLIICVIFSIEFNLLRMFRLWKFYSKAYQKPKSIKCWTDFCWSVQRKRAAVKLILNL